MRMLDNSYHEETVHRNVQKTISDGMAKVGNYIKEDNILKKVSNETGFTVRLHFSEEREVNNVIEEIQKILTETYIKNLTLKGGK